MIEWKYNSTRQRYNNVFPTGNELQKIRFRLFYASLLLYYYYYYYSDDYTYRRCRRRRCTAEKRDSGSQKCKTARPPPVTDDHWLRYYSLIRSITAAANRRRRRRTVVCYYFGPVRFCFWIIIVYSSAVYILFLPRKPFWFELPSDPFHLLSDAHVPHTPIRHRPSSRYNIVNVRHYVVVAVRVAAEWRFPYRRWWCSPTDPTVDVR